MVAPVLLVSVDAGVVVGNQAAQATVPPVLVPMLTECAEPLVIVPLKVNRSCAAPHEQAITRCDTERAAARFTVRQSWSKRHCSCRRLRWLK